MIEITPPRPGTEQLHEEANSMAALGRMVVVEAIKKRNSAGALVSTPAVTGPIQTSTQAPAVTNSIFSLQHSAFFFFFF